MNAYHSNRTRVFRRTLLAACCTAAATPAFAQSAASPAAAASDVQRVEVTGSRLKQLLFSPRLGVTRLNELSRSGRAV